MVEKESLRYLAEAAFKENGELNITGQGTLRCVFLSAHLSEDTHKIYPPEEHCFFHKNTHTDTDSSLIEKVSVFYILSREEAEQLIVEWEEWLIGEARRNPVKFGDYGSFVFEEALEFVPESELFYEWLPVLEYKKALVPAKDLPGKNLVRSFASDHEQEFVRTEPKNPKKRPAGKYVLGSVLLLLFLFSFPYWIKPLHALIDGGPVVNRKLVNVAPENYDYPVDLERYSDTEFTDGAEKEMILEKAEEDTEITETENERIGADIIPEKHEAETIVMDEPAGHGTDTRRCTLIVGGFAEPGNIDRMVQSLEGMNLETVTLKRKTITLVGARINCDHKAKIEEVKEMIEPNAWVYHQ